MSPFRYLAGSIVFLSAIIVAAPVEAGFHLWQIAEIYSNGDGSVQFIELFTTGSGETQASPAEIRTDSGKVYEFTGNITGGATTNKRLLIATNDFELLPGAVLPNFGTSPGLVANFFNPVSDQIRLFHPTFGEFHARTFTSVPTDNVFSRVFLPSTADAANSPTNFAGTSGSVNRGDYNADGVVDASDYAVWRKTFGQSASPAGSGADGNTSGSIEDGDHTLWINRFGNAIAGGSGAGGGTAIAPEPAALGLVLLAWTALMPRRSRS